jgi:transcriptional regulator with XRE-family HTH domain
MERDIGKRFGSRLKQLREANGVTQNQLAKQLLKSVETISNFERGKTLPGLLTIAKLASALGVEPKQLFEFDAKPSTEPELARLSQRLSLLTNSDRTLLADFADLLVRRQRTS